MVTINRKQFVKISGISFILIMAGLILMLNSSFAIDIPDVLDHLPTSGDIDDLHLVSGRYAENIELTSNDSYLALKYMVKISTNSLRVILPDEFIRMEVLEYDADYNYLGITDMATYDYFTKKDDTAYLLFSFYKSDEYGELVESTYEELYELFTSGEFSFIEIDDINSEEMLNADPTPHAYLSYKSLLNSANLKMGKYNNQWGSKMPYILNEDNVTLRHFYKVVPGHTYYISLNDSRISAYPHLMTSEQIWKTDVFGYPGTKENAKFAIPSNCSVITFNYYTTAYSKSVSPHDVVFKYGARAVISKDSYYFTGTLSEDRMPVISNKDEWREGQFGFYRGEFYASFGTYASKVYYTEVPKGVTYKFVSSNIKYKLSIIEIDADGNNIGETTLDSDMHFVFNDNTYKYALIIYNKDSYTSKSYVDFLDALDDGLAISFEPYVEYEYNTVMKDITNQEMMQLMGVGWNLGNSLDSKKGGTFSPSTSYTITETAYGNPYITEELIKYVKSLGFDTIRIPVTYINNWYYDENGNYKIRTEYLDRVQEVVNYAIKAGLYVVINTHFDSGVSFSPIRVGAETAEFDNAKVYAKQIWTQIATRFRNYDEHLMFEAYNEVDNTYKSRLCTPIAAAQMNELNQLFVDVVRSTGGNNEKRILQIQTFLSSWSITAVESFEAPTDMYPDKLIAQVHIYPSFWDEKFEETLDLFDKFTERTGLPIVVGEFSITAKTYPTVYKYTLVSNFIARAKAHNVVVYYWDNNSDRQIIDRTTLTIADQKLYDAIMNPVAYTGPEMTWLDSFSDFTSGTFNASNGSYTEKYSGWGTLITKKIEVEEGMDFVRVSEIVRGEADGRYIHYLYFYDENDNYIAEASVFKKYPGVTDMYLAVPATAKYFRVVIYSSHYKTLDSDYQRYFEEGNLKLGYAFENPDIDRTVIDTPISDGETKLTSIYDFDWGTLYSDTGAVTVNTWWYAINTSYISIPEGSTKLNLKFYHQGFGNLAAISAVVFYDENKEYISGTKYYGYAEQTELDIPENAKYIIIGVNTSAAIGRELYYMMFTSGDCALIYSFN